jgi:plastocyanin
MPRTARAAALSAALLFALLSCQKAPVTTLTRSYQVRIADMKFEPDALTVHPGDTVIWRNEDMVAHTVVGGPLHSSSIADGQTYQWTAGEPADIPYVCTLHPMMKASVTVRQ